MLKNIIISAICAMSLSALARTKNPKNSTNEIQTIQNTKPSKPNGQKFWCIGRIERDGSGGGRVCCEHHQSSGGTGIYRATTGCSEQDPNINAFAGAAQ